MNDADKIFLQEIAGPYACDGCGACCAGPLGVSVSRYDILREPRLIEHISNIEDKDRHRTNNGGWDDYKLSNCGQKCPLLEDGKCSIYATRPTLCVCFKAGSWQCQYSRKVIGLDFLPRIDGDFHDGDVVQQFERALKFRTPFTHPDIQPAEVVACPSPPEIPIENPDEISNALRRKTSDILDRRLASETLAEAVL